MFVDCPEMLLMQWGKKGGGRRGEPETVRISLDYWTNLLFATAYSYLHDLADRCLKFSAANKGLHASNVDESIMHELVNMYDDQC